MLSLWDLLDVVPVNGRTILIDSRWNTPTDKSRTSIKHAPSKYKVGWEGGVVVINGNIYDFYAKVLKTNSKYGINNGRIIKLNVNDIDENECLAYNRMWTHRVGGDEVRAVLSLILNEFK